MSRMYEQCVVAVYQGPPLGARQSGGKVRRVGAAAAAQVHEVQRTRAAAAASVEPGAGARFERMCAGGGIGRASQRKPVDAENRIGMHALSSVAIAGFGLVAMHGVLALGGS